jgi:hypothetical protein
MTTAVIGTGGIGSVIARLLASGGETLRLSSADKESARRLAAEIGRAAVDAVDNHDALRRADAVVLALRFGVLRVVMDEIADQLTEKLVVVPSNPVGIDAQGNVSRLLPEGAILRRGCSRVPAVVDTVAPVPVIAAGAIGDARGVAAVLALGAQAAWLGTRFLLAQEMPVHEQYRRRVMDAVETDTQWYANLYEVGWPDAPNRSLRNSTAEVWEATGGPPPRSRPGGRRHRALRLRRRNPPVRAGGAHGRYHRRYRSNLIVGRTERCAH